MFWKKFVFPGGRDGRRRSWRGGTSGCVGGERVRGGRAGPWGTTGGALEELHQLPLVELRNVDKNVENMTNMSEIRQNDKVAESFLKSKMMTNSRLK